jgi:hypothetical protein
MLANLLRALITSKKVISIYHLSTFGIIWINVFEGIFDLLQLAITLELFYIHFDWNEWIPVEHSKYVYN